MTDQHKLLVVDDEVNIRRTLVALLQRAGYTVESAENGFDAVALLERQSFDLLLVDLKMPGMDGMQVVAAARARQPDIAVIVLTGHGSMETAIEGLHQGIFDYLLKTTEPNQVIERVKAGLVHRTQQIRQRSLLDVMGNAIDELRSPQSRSEAAEHGGGSERLVVAGALQIDTWRQVATIENRSLSLTPTEFRVLLCLAEHAGNMLSYAQLVRCAQGYDADEAEAGDLIKPHIHHLRQKIEPDPSAPRYLLNVRGKGYLFSPVGG